MSFSLNEIETNAKKAARGAGFSWGLAEEAGKATRWLCAQGLDGCASLAALLQEPLHATPHIGPGIWSAPGPLCPLATGAALSDFAARLADGPIRIVAVAQPQLLLPFAAGAARHLKTVVKLNCDTLTARTDGDGLEMARIPSPPGTSDVLISLDGAMTGALPKQTRASPDPAIWAVLTGFAGRTYAPASDASRRLGAGAGLSDND
jgi:uncharacterized protein DUF3726